MNFLVILPLVFVMIGGPQILSAIFLATSEEWRRNSAAFVANPVVLTIWATSDSAPAKQRSSPRESSFRLGVSNTT